MNAEAIKNAIISAQHRGGEQSTETTRTLRFLRSLVVSYCTLLCRSFTGWQPDHRGLSFRSSSLCRLCGSRAPFRRRSFRPRSASCSLKFTVPVFIPGVCKLLHTAPPAAIIVSLVPSSAFGDARLHPPSSPLFGGYALAP